MEIQIICGRNPRCGFRVDAGYFERKVRFIPGVCPNCGGPVALVQAYTDQIVNSAALGRDPYDRSYRKVTVEA